MSVMGLYEDGREEDYYACVELRSKDRSFWLGIDRWAFSIGKLVEEI